MHPRREEDDAEHDRRDDEGELDPEVAADVVVADREREADDGEHERRRAAERALEQHRARRRAAGALVPARRLVDPRRVAAERRRQHLPGRVADEVRAHEPRERVVHAARGEQPLPAPRHRPDRADHDRERGEPPAGARVREHVRRLAEVDLPDDVGGAEAGDDERRADAHGSRHATASTGPVTSRMRAAASAAAAAAAARVLARREHRARAVGRAAQLAEDVARLPVDADGAHALDRERTLEPAHLPQLAGRRDEEADAGAADDRDRRELVRRARPRRARPRPRARSRRRRARARQSSASWPPPTRAESFASERPVRASRSCVVVGPSLDAELARRGRARCRDRGAYLLGSSSAGQRCASGTPNAGGGACIAVGHRERHEACRRARSAFTVTPRARAAPRRGSSRRATPRARRRWRRRARPACARGARRARRGGPAPRRRPG